jgi:hypothetical protein
MAAALLLITASGLVTKVLENARSAAATYLWKPVISQLGLGDNESDEMRDDMKKAFDELASIHLEVKQLGSQVS